MSWGGADIDRNHLRSRRSIVETPPPSALIHSGCSNKLGITKRPTHGIGTTLTVYPTGPTRTIPTAVTTRRSLKSGATPTRRPRQPAELRRPSASLAADHIPAARIPVKLGPVKLGRSAKTMTASISTASILTTSISTASTSPASTSATSPVAVAPVVGVPTSDDANLHASDTTIELKPIGESIEPAEPAGDPVAEPAGDPVAEPAGDSVAERAGDLVAERAGNFVAEPDGELDDAPEAGTLLAELESRQDDVLEQLDALEKEVLAVLKHWTPERPTDAQGNEVAASETATLETASFEAANFETTNLAESNT